MNKVMNHFEEKQTAIDEVVMENDYQSEDNTGDESINTD